MADTGFLVPADKLKRYAKAFANDPDTGRPQSVLDLSKPLKFDCGGGCAASTAADYMRFAQMLLNGGQFGGKRVLGRKTVEYMLSNQLAPGVVNLIGNADPTSADLGFGPAAPASAPPHPSTTFCSAREICSRVSAVSIVA
jgi:CubicO group peptidase (beta-lactamase class C family)